MAVGGRRKHEPPLKLVAASQRVFLLDTRRSPAKYETLRQPGLIKMEAGHHPSLRHVLVCVLHSPGLLATSGFLPGGDEANTPKDYPWDHDG